MKFFDVLLAMGAAWTISGVIQVCFNTNKTILDTPFWGPGGRGWAAAVLLAFSLALLDNIVRDQIKPGMIRLAVFSILRSGYYLLGPALWLYGQSIAGLQDKQKKSESMKKQILLHAAPFLFFAAAGIILPDFFFDPAHRQDRGSSIIYMERNASAINLAVIRDTGSIFSRLIYAILTLKLMIRHGRTVPHAYSHLSLRNTLSWLRVLIISYILLFLVQLAFTGVSRFFSPMPHMAPQQVNTVAALLRIMPPVAFVFFFSFYSPDQNAVTAEIDAADKIGKYRKSPLSAYELQCIHEKLVAHITEHKSFLDPELTLDQLAAQMKTSRHTLSQVINQNEGENFYGFINDRHIQEFQQALAENRYPEYTISAIAFECGFSSSSAFYKAFRARTGKTPKEYAAHAAL